MVAFAALALWRAWIDWQATIARGYAYRLASSDQVLTEAAPERYGAAVSWLEGSAVSWLWDPVLKFVFDLPLALVLAALALVLFLTRPRARGRG